MILENIFAKAIAFFGFLVYNSRVALIEEYAFYGSVREFAAGVSKWIGSLSASGAFGDESRRGLPEGLFEWRELVSLQFGWYHGVIRPMLFWGVAFLFFTDGKAQYKPSEKPR